MSDDGWSVRRRIERGERRRLCWNFNTGENFLFGIAKNCEVYQIRAERPDSSHFPVGIVFDRTVALRLAAFVGQPVSTVAEQYGSVPFGLLEAMQLRIVVRCSAIAKGS